MNNRPTNISESNQTENFTSTTILSLLTENFNRALEAKPTTPLQDKVEVFLLRDETSYGGWKVINNVVKSIQNNTLTITNTPTVEFVPHHTISRSSQKYFIPSLKIMFDQNMTKVQYVDEIPEDSKPIKGLISSALAEVIKDLADLHQKEKLLKNRLATEKNLEFSFYLTGNEPRIDRPQPGTAAKRLIFSGTAEPGSDEKTEEKNTQQNQTSNMPLALRKQ